ncbi:TPA: hypothetical protein N0F65_001664 [Lagenidium giganteum]|uniref:Uncharacterized protein n=1 Tax=Lagenidium giganteum TaxID=4803 RepID=A0AAV2Z405_9STRA|nr:TPA: hypothetical protein N0F65_001664 [Lagenidium giganteum]
MASLMLASVLAVAALAFAQAKEVVPLDHWYAFDGTHSDFTQQFYRRFEAGESLPPLQIDGVPKEIQQFLGSHGVSFDGLPGLLQRAVIWDFGYALDNDLNLGKIYTRCGRSMAQIAVPMKAYERTGCTVQNCTAPDGRPHHRSFRCNGLQMATVSMCASEAVTRPGHTSMWADGGDDEFIPEVRVVRHDWTELGKSYLMFALHVEPDDSEKAWSICPSAPSMIIPCRPLAMVKTKKAWCRPVRGKVLGPWIRNYANDHRRVTVIELTLIVGAVMIVAVPLARFLQKRRKKRSAQESMEDHQAIVGSNGLRSSFNSLRSSTDMTLARPSSALENSDAYNYLEAVAQQDEPLGTATWSFKSGKELGQRASVSSGRQRAALRTLQAFESHPLINHKRISLRKIQVVRQLSTSATSEVWLALYNMHQVAIKHLIQRLARRCLEKDPDKRPQAQSIVEELSRFHYEHC